MLVKFNSFVEGASAELQATEASVTYLTEIKLRFSELRTAFEEVLVLKYNQRLEASNEIFKQIPMGLGDEKIAECIQELQKWQMFQPAPKVQPLKLLGKEAATEIEGYMASLTSVSKLLQAALPKLAKLSQTNDDSAMQSLLMNDMMTNLVASLHKKDVIYAVEKLAPILREGLGEVKRLISSAVADWASRMASTFDTFLGSLMSPEIILESVLKAEVTGTLGQEGDEGIDWSGIYAGFVHFQQGAKVKVNVDMGGSKQNIEVHVAFLCLAGALLQVAKYAFAVAQVVGDVSKKLNFAETYKEEQAKKKKSGSKMDGLLAFLPHLPRAAAAFKCYENIIDKIEGEVGYMDNIKDFAKKLTGTFQTSLQQCSQEMYQELDNMKGIFATLFTAVKEKHELIAIFQAEKLSEALVSPLLSDPNATYLLFLGGKAGPYCEGISTFAQAMNRLPKETMLLWSKTLQSLLQLRIRRCVLRIAGSHFHM
jgi:ribosomal protein L21E